MNRARVSKVITEEYEYVSILNVLKHAKQDYLFSLITYLIPFIGKLTREYFKTNAGFCNYFRYILWANKEDYTEHGPKLANINVGDRFCRQHLVHFTDLRYSPGKYSLYYLFYYPLTFKGLWLRYKHLNRAIKHFKTELKYHPSNKMLIKVKTKEDFK